MSSQIGLIGLGTMGSHLAQNIARRGYRVSVWNRTQEKVTEFVRIHGEESFFGASNIEEFVESLEQPRKIIVMLPDGKPTQEVLNRLLLVLDAGDSVMDGANALFKMTEQNQKQFEERGIHFLGCGISGGAEGALNGPSLMPGGSYEAWMQFEPILMKIAAADFEGRACVSYMGGGGAGHYVKMVHNGIEYAEMQSLAEAYDLLKSIYHLDHGEILSIFRTWSKGELKSYLLETVVDIFEKTRNGEPAIEQILDKAGQKGTGTWTSQEALNLGVATTSITASVFARAVSSNHELRLGLSEKISSPYRYSPVFTVADFVPILEKALVLARVSHFAQGLDLLKMADQNYGYHLPFGEILRVWQGGCIIRNEMLKNMQKAFKENAKQHLFETEFAQEKIRHHEMDLRRVVSTGVSSGIPLFALSGALTLLDSMRQKRCAANVIQGLRDAFGHHGFEWMDALGQTAHWGEDL